MAALDAPALVEAIVSRLQAAYIFPDRAAEAEQLLRANLTAGKYSAPVDEHLCLLINEDLLVACADKHLRLIWHEASEDTGESPQSEEDLIAGLREMFRAENYGIRRVERLPGNVGLIALTIIPEAATAGEPIAAAMRLVQHTHGLILDLRATRGGAPDGVAFLASFCSRTARCSSATSSRAHMVRPASSGRRAIFPGPDTSTGPCSCSSAAQRSPVAKRLRMTSRRWDV